MAQTLEKPGAASSPGRVTHLDSLTYLRGIAAALVMLSHCKRVSELDAQGNPTHVPALLSVLDFGTFGVVLFFALSGFTLYLAYGGRPLNWASFFTRRVFRVYPAFLVSIPIYLASEYLIQRAFPFGGSYFIRLFAHTPSIKVMIEYLTFTFNIAGDWNYVNPIYWSLPVEFQFYLLFPFLMMLLRRSAWLLALPALGLLAIGNLLSLEWETFQLAWQFIAGIAIAAVWAQRTKRGSFGFGFALFAAAICLAIVTRFYTDWLPHFPWMASRFEGTYEGFYYGIAGALMLSGAPIVDAALPHIGRPLRRFLAWQGDISYSLYIFHCFSLLLCYALAGALGLAGGRRVVLIYGVAIPLSYAFAALSYAFVEKRGIAAGKELSAA